MILKGQPIITSPLIALLFRAFYFQLYVTSRLREPLEIKEHLLVLGYFSRLLMAARCLGLGSPAPLMFPLLPPVPDLEDNHVHHRSMHAVDPPQSIAGSDGLKTTAFSSQE